MQHDRGHLPLIVAFEIDGRIGHADEEFVFRIGVQADRRLVGSWTPSGRPGE